jgi:hypothetical protein
VTTPAAASAMMNGYWSKEVAERGMAETAQAKRKEKTTPESY